MKQKIFKIKIGNAEFSISFLLSVLSAIFGALFSFLSAKFLKAYLYGEIHYYVSIVTLLSTFMIFGTDNYVVKNTQFEESKQPLVSKSIVFVSLLSTLILPIYFRIGISLLSRLNGDTVLIMAIFAIALMLALSTIGYAFLQGNNKYQLRMLFSSFLPHLFFLLIFFIHFVTKTLSLFIDIYLLYYAIFYGSFGIYIVIRYLIPVKGTFLPSQIKSIVFFGLTWALYNITTPLSNIFIGEKYDNLGIVGIFSLSNQLLTVSGLATGIVNQISNTTFAKLVKENATDSVFKNYERITRISIYLSVPFYAAFIVEAQNLLGFFGDSYLGHNSILVLLTIASLIECITGPCGTILLMGNKERENFVASLVKFVVFISILCVLIHFTELAAPIGLVVSSLISNLIKLLFLHSVFKKNFFSLKVFLTFVIVLVISLCSFFGLSFIKNTVIWLIANIIVGLGLIIGFIVITPFKEDRKYFIKGKEL